MSNPIPEAPLINYASAIEEIRARALVGWAKLFGILPLVAGFGCLLGFAIFREELFAIGGLYMLGLGPISVGIGLTLIIIYRVINRLTSSELRRTVGRDTRNTVLLLLANIPAAIFCTVVGIALIERFKGH